MPTGMPEPNYPTDQLDVLRHEFGFVAFVEFGTKSHGIARRALDEAAKLRTDLSAATARAETAEAAYHRLDSAQAAHGSYAARAEAAEAELRSAHLRANRAENAAAELDKQAERYHARALKLEAQREQLRNERDAATARAEQAEVRAQHLDEEALRLQRTIDEARKQRDDWHDEATRQRNRAETAEAERDGWLDSFDAIRAEKDVETARAMQAEAERDQFRARLANLKAAGMQYRANGPHVHGVTEGNVRDYFADQWVEGYWPEGRQLYAGPWQRIDKVCDDATPHADLDRLAAEQGVKPVTSIDQLTAALEDRPSEAEFAAFMDAIRRGDDGRGDR